MSEANHQNTQARITLESLSEPNEIPFVRWDSRNAGFIAVCGASGGLLAREIGMGITAISLVSMICIYIGYDIVRSTPPYANVIEWIRANITYLRQPREFTNSAEAHVETDSTIRAAIQTPETTRDLTGVSRLYPPHGVIKRVDNSYAVLLRYTPPNQDFNTEQEFLNFVTQLETAYNEMGNFDITAHATTRPVNMERYFDQLAERMDDDDVEQNEVFKAILQEMKQHRKRMLEETDTETTHYYVILSVDENEAQKEIGGDEDAHDRSRLFRLLGRTGTSPEDGDSAEKKKQQRLQKLLNERIEKVKKMLVKSTGHLGGGSVETVPVTEAAAILESYWTSRQVPLDPDEREPVPITRTTTEVAGDQAESTGEVPD